MTPVFALNEALLAAGLPLYRSVVGATFVFGDLESGHFISGTITSIGYAPSEGILLYVSAPRYKGMQLRRIAKVRDEWTAIGIYKGEERTGTLEIL